MHRPYDLENFPGGEKGLMTSRVIVLSADTVRGHIIQMVLKQKGIPVLWCKNFLDCQEAIRGQCFRIVIFDTVKYSAKGLELLSKLRYEFGDITLLVLTDKALLETIEAMGMARTVCLVEPLDPELLVEKVWEYSSLQSERLNNNDTEPTTAELTKKIKQFLRLD